MGGEAGSLAYARSGSLTRSDTPGGTPMPLYLQVASVLRGRLENGHWGPGERLPRVDDLAREFGVARVTVRQALGLLAGEGLLWRRQGKGTFVSDRDQFRERLNLESDWTALLTMIEGTTLEVLARESGVACPRLRFGDGTPAKAYEYLRRVHSKDGVAYAVIDIFLDEDVFALAPEEFLRETVLSVFGRVPGVSVHRAYQTLTVGTADVEHASLLRIPVDAPVVHVRRIVCDENDKVIYFGDVVYRGNFVKLHIDLVSDGQVCRRT